MARRDRQTLRRSRAEPNSLPAFLAWLGGQSWPVWIKITLFVVIIIAVLGLTGGRAISCLVGALR
jgi:hypothetical protein